MTPEEIRKIAQEEVDAEDLREAIDREKERIRTHKPWLHVIFPWKIVIIKR